MYCEFYYFLHPIEIMSMIKLDQVKRLMLIW